MIRVVLARGVSIKMGVKVMGMGKEELLYLGDWRGNSGRRFESR